MSDEDSLLRHGLELQIAVLACQAIETGDPIGFLHNQLVYHNLAEYHLHDKGPLRYMLLLSDDRASYALAAKASAAAVSSKPKLQPTAYVVIANRVIDSNPHCPAVSFANFCSGMKPCGFELAEGTTISNVVLQCLSTLPMYTLFNLLGQGYKVVLAGRQFGGVIAHALAAKLLLQVQHEMQMAKKMGIDLSALSRTGEKVVSFGFMSPLFANGALQKALSDCGHSGNLHTLWRTRDASPAFLTLCSNVFAALEVPGRHTSGTSNAAAAAGTAPTSSAPPKVSRSNTLLRHANTGGFKAINRWAAVTGDELKRSARKVEQKFSASPLDVADLAKGSSQGAAAGNAPASSIHATDGLARPKISIPLSPARPSTSSVGSPTAARASPTAARPSPAAASAARPSPVAVRTSLSGANGPSTPKKLLPTTASPRASASGKDPAPASAAATATASSPSKYSADAIWKAALTELLAQGGPSAVGETLSPVGRFWLLERKGGAGSESAAAASPKSAKAGSSAAASKDQAAVYSLEPLAPASAAAKAMGWLAAGNKDLFSRWEYSLEELKRDLIEVYAWSTFKTTVEFDGEPVDRKAAMRQTRLDIA